jgi:cytoskeletal protein RodZ
VKKLLIGIGVFLFAAVAFAGGDNTNKNIQEPLGSMPAATSTNVQAPTTESPASVESTAPTASSPTSSTPSTNSGSTYTNVDGNTVQSPTYSDSIPEGATAQCEDGGYSFSQHRSGTCSHHGGVAEWL